MMLFKEFLENKEEQIAQVKEIMNSLLYDRELNLDLDQLASMPNLADILISKGYSDPNNANRLANMVKQYARYSNVDMSRPPEASPVAQEPWTADEKV